MIEARGAANSPSVLFGGFNSSTGGVMRRGGTGDGWGVDAFAKNLVMPKTPAKQLERKVSVGKASSKDRKWKVLAPNATVGRKPPLMATIAKIMCT